MIRSTIVAWSVVALLAVTSHCHAHVGYPGRETATAEPFHDGTYANAPIPVHMHKRNEGGSDGAGLCVICTLYINGTYQGIPRATLDRMWALAKSRPGGYSPDKLQALLDEVMPGEKWASYVGVDADVLDRLNRLGYPIGATMNTGEGYGWQKIHHMVSLVHFDRERDIACVVDNNFPGRYSWMTAKEYERRWIDGGTGWAFVWLRRDLLPIASDYRVVGVLIGVGVFASIMFYLFVRKDDDPDLDDEDFLG